MADTPRWFGRRGHTTQAPLRVLTASATRLNLNDRKQRVEQRAMRQGWQSEAWAFRDAIGELRYAVNFLANCAARMKLYVAAYPSNGEADNPVPLGDLDEQLPAGLEAAAQAAMRDLGNGRLSVSGLLRSLSTNLSVAGECFLLGQADSAVAPATWSVRSVDEIQIDDASYRLRELPGSGIDSTIQLDPELNMVARIWSPHPRYGLLADSPLRAILDDCESLLILRRMIRATGRSRLAGRGLLLIPNELSIKVPDDQNADPEADPFLRALTESMMEPIGDEGVASAVVPIIVRGPADVIDKVQHLDFASTFDEQGSKTRDELVGIIATGLDIPKEIIAGMADLNHWTAWQVDDNTFRHHVEPHVAGCCDSLTGAYLRPYLEAAGIDESWAQRALLWYDPTELVTHPDQTADAMQLYDRHALSAEALTRVAGFNEQDMPPPEETVVRMLQNMRTPPPNLVMAAVHQMFPQLTIPPIEMSGTVPGVKPSGVDIGEAVTPPPGGTPPPVAVDNAPPIPPTDGEPGPPPDAVTASGAQAKTRLSHRLARIDADLRARLQTAANAAMLRALEKAGARLRSRVARDESLRSKIAHRPNERAAAILGEALVASLDVTSNDLLGPDWSGLRDQFHSWTEAAQQQALATAIRLGGLTDDASAVKAAQTALQTDRETAWDVLSTALTNLANHLLYNPDPNTEAGDWGALNPDTLVDVGTIRTALAVAGGATVTGVTADIAGRVTMAATVPVGQIGTGATITDLLSSAGLTTQGFVWEHGPALNPFEPHAELDGVEFENFDDPVLANPGDFPPVDFFIAGDHNGCSCDWAPMWQ